MKFKLLFIIFGLMIINNAHSQTEEKPFETSLNISSSFSAFFSENQMIFSSLSIGTKLNFLLYDKYDNILSNIFRISLMGLDYQYSFIENNHYLAFSYGILPFPPLEYYKYGFLPCLYLGINGAYNINKNIFVVIPEIGISLYTLLTLTYKYNIMIDNNIHNKHEVSLRFSFPLFILLNIRNIMDYILEKEN